MSGGSATHHRLVGSFASQKVSPKIILPKTLSESSITSESAQVMHDKTSWINQPAQSLRSLNHSDDDVRNLVVTTTSENSFNRLESNHNAINHPSPNVEQNGSISLLARQRQYQYITSLKLWMPIKVKNKSPMRLYLPVTIL
jgi:hypothetical protein